MHIVNRKYNNLRHAVRDNADNAPRPFETISTVAFDRHVYFYVVIFYHIKSNRI
jgi:hypothetical protein